MLVIKEFPGNSLDEDADLDSSKMHIVVLEQGYGKVVLDGVQKEVVPDKMLFIGIGSRFQVSFITGLGHVLSFDRMMFDYFLLHYPLARRLSLFGSVNSFRLPAGQFDLINERLQMLSLELVRGSSTRHLKLLFSLFLLDVVGDRLVDLDPVDSDRAVLDVFSELLERYFKEERNSGFYADKVGVTMRKLNGLCRGWFDGKGFSEVMRDRLLSEAEFMLLGSDVAIKVVAFELGFCSQQHFRGYFKRFRGVSPLLFREERNKNIAPKMG